MIRLRLAFLGPKCFLLFVTFALGSICRFLPIQYRPRPAQAQAKGIKPKRGDIHALILGRAQTGIHAFF
jgi:hypothetical protein